MRWHDGERTPKTLPGLLLGLVAASLPAIAVHRLGAAHQDPRPATPGTAEIATVRLLDALAEKRMDDVVLAVLDRAAADTSVTEAFRAGLPLRRATALSSLARREPAGPRRGTLLEQAGTEVDRALEGRPQGDDLIAALTRKGSLLVERGRLEAIQAKKAGEDAARRSAEAVRLFDAGIASLGAPPRDAGAEIPPPTNAEDAVLLELRQVDAAIAAMKSAGKEKSGEDSGSKKARRPARKTAGDVKQLERLENRQDRLRGELLQTRLLVGNAWTERAAAFPAGSDEWRSSLRTAVGKYRALFEKYPKWGAGLYARCYEGRNLVALAREEKDPQARTTLLDAALLALANVRGLEGESGFVPSLRAKAINTSLEAWLALARFDQFDPRLERLALANVPAERLDADWLGMKYRAGLLLAEKAEALPPDQKGRRPTMLRDAKKLASEVARQNRDFARDARALLERLGRAVPDDDDDPAAGFATAYDIATGALAAMQEKQAEAKAAAAAGKTAEADAAAAAAAVERSRATESLRRALSRGGEVPLDDVNRARSLLAFLLYDERRYHEAAAVGTLLAEHHPSAPGARQAARIAMASFQALGREGPEAWRSAARSRCADVAETILRIWPKDPESADAAQVAIASALQSHDIDRLLAIAAAVPPDAARPSETLLRAGSAIWREVLERRRLPEDARPSSGNLAEWKAAAVSALDRGLAAVPEGGAVSQADVAGALSRCQIALEDGDDALAAKLLEHPRYGGWTLLESGAPIMTGSLAENAASVALRSFIQSRQVDRARDAMRRLESAAGEGPEAAARLAGIYQAMGRDLQGQLEAIAAAGTGEGALKVVGGAGEADPRVSAILSGFEAFLDGVASRDPRVSSQMWVATTYLSLGSGTDSAKVVPRSKANGFLARAAEVFEGLLGRSAGPDAQEIDRFVPAIRLKLAGAYAEMGRWDEALGHVDWILSDPKRQNALDVQVQAATILQQAGERSTDAAAAPRFLREAIAGRKSGSSVVWGWGGIANRLARQASDPRAGDARTAFFDARLNVVRCRLALLEKPGQDRAKLLQMARNDVAITYRLYPDLGGEASRARFDALLRTIQKDQGESMPRGLAEFDEPITEGAE